MNIRHVAQRRLRNVVIAAFTAFLSLCGFGAVCGLGLPGRSSVVQYTVPKLADPTAYWQTTMQEVHSHFTGQHGTFAQFGDSITVTQAFWAPLKYVGTKVPPTMQRDLATVRGYIRPESWSAWKGAPYGSDSGKTSQWAEENADQWLKALNPEIVLIMFGTNDLRTMEVAEYRKRMRSVVQKCLRNGTIVILSTIPPRHDFVKKAAEFSAAVRGLADELHVPITDFEDAILKRRPTDWDGAQEAFRSFDDYDVPTLISRDGVHPSLPKAYQDDYTAEGLSHSGYNLRNYVALQTVAQVIRTIHRVDQAREGTAASVEPPRPQADTSPPVQPWFPKAPPLPTPVRNVLRVSNVEQLADAVQRVKPGGTILLADGIYHTGPIEIKTDGVTLRSASRQRDRVVLDADNQGELVRISHCSGVTVADLTVQNVMWNGIKLNTDTNVQHARIYNCVLHNIWQRAVKGVIVPPERREAIRPRGCRIEYCLFYNDRPKRFEDDPSDTAQTFNGNYIGGIDVMYARDWVISDNAFIGIHGRTGEARGAVFLWNDVQNCIVERNIIINCDAGICLGNASRGPGTIVHCTGCIVRNNFLSRVPENGIVSIYTRDCRILHNTVYDPVSRLGRLIRLVFDNDGLVVANNLLCGKDVLVETTSRVQLVDNVAKDLTRSLANPAEGDLHLKAPAPEVVGKALRLKEVMDDIDRKPRSSPGDIGAHEWRRQECLQVTRTRAGLR